ncbi:hypothetical protein HanXRQr2_Chr17g0820441 [Helianthus annuus]|uniref:Uncharacterized protein n=1 Tax=Helianthus annuus TaxID=4232 RepID=A0A9K3DMV7_HELAN|nr:hypothetical protein HanXRQr2_Chr17g0820441 [Helianthus annuus]
MVIFNKTLKFIVTFFMYFASSVIFFSFYILCLLKCRENLQPNHNAHVSTTCFRLRRNARVSH